MQPGQVVGDRYRLEHLIGEGGIGQVFRARDLMTRELVALKALRPEFARDARIKRRFMREARAVARLQHPHIVRLFTCGDSDDAPYIAMELIEGQALSEHRDQGLHLDTLMTVVDQTLSALAFAHARGVVHRDVKPENILVSWVDRGRRPFIKLLDFGFARVEGDQDVKLTQVQGDAFGTPLYMAPEQASAKGNVGPETDLYAMGVILFEFLSGQPPFTGAHGMAVALKHVMEPVPALRPRTGLAMPFGLEDVVRRALEKEPRNRWRTAADMRRALAQFAPGGEPARAVEDADDQTMAGPNGPPPALPGTGGAGPAAGPFDDEPRSDPTLVTDLVRGPTTGAHPVPIFRALEPEPSGAGVAEALFADPDTQALVGREAELMWLWERAREVCDGAQARVALLGGTPGMGKRRLLRWLEDQVAEGAWMHHVTVEQAATPEATLRTDLRALLAAVFGGLPVERRPAEQVVLQALERWAAMPSVLPRPEPAMLGVLASTLAAWLCPAPGGVATDETGELRGEALYARALELFQIAARERPVLLTIESIEEAGPETCGFLAWAARWLRRVELPMLVVAGYTLDEGGAPRHPMAAAFVGTLGAVGAPEVQSLTLEPLDAATVAALLSSITPIEATVAEAIARRTGGNPYFARELLLWASQAGELSMEAGRLVLSRAARPQAWPASLPETLLLRTDETLARKPGGAVARRVLECAALLGEHFEYELLVAFLAPLLGDRSAVERGVELLLQCNIFGESGTLEGDRLFLRHDVMVGPLRERLAAGGQLAALHLQAAETLQRVYARNPAAFALQIGAHFEAGGATGEAAHQYQLAATVRRDHGQIAAACELLERADALLAQSTTPGADLKRASGWLDLGELELRRGQQPRARTLAGRVYTWARQNGQPGLEGRALLLVSDLFRRQAQLAEAARGYAQARAVFERAQDRTGYARSLLGAAMVERSLGRVEAAVELFELARQAMEAAGDHHGLARAWRGQGEIALRMGELVAARDRLELARQAYATAGDTHGVTFCHWLLGETFRLLGQPDLAVSHFEASRRGHEVLRDDVGRGRAHLSLARLFRDRGLWGDAETHFAGAVLAYDAAGDAPRAAAARAELGLGALLQRRFDAARAHLGTALAHVLQSGDAERAAVLRASLAWVYAEQGDEALAEPELRAALSADATRPIVDADFARALEGIADVDAYLGRRPRAGVLLQRAADVHAALGAAAEVDRLLRKLALLSSRVGGRS
ncbi:protein kinase [Myxococcota bacterium]|nr:protein kinase [Myxococcota bacterium]